MFRSALSFIGTSLTVVVFTIFATSNVDSIVGTPHKTYSMQKILIHIKKQVCLLNVPICTQGMQRTWWPESGTIIVTGPYWTLTKCILQYRLRNGGNFVQGEMNSMEYIEPDKTKSRLWLWYMTTQSSYFTKWFQVWIIWLFEMKTD